MARPKGHRLNGGALRDILTIKGLSMTEAAGRCGISLTTLSGLVQGHHRASDKVVRSVQEGLELQHTSTLFPAFAGFEYVEPVKPADEVAA